VKKATREIPGTPERRGRRVNREKKATPATGGSQATPGLRGRRERKEIKATPGKKAMG